MAEIRRLFNRSQANAVPGYTNPLGTTKPQTPLGLAPILTVGGEGPDIDVVKNFPWTLTPQSSPARDETPYIRLQEYYLLDSYIDQLFSAYATKPANAQDILDLIDTPGLLTGKQLYDGLYDHKNPTGFSYKLPFFSSNYLTTSNSWTEKAMYEEIISLQKISSSIEAGGAAGAVGAGLGLALGGEASPMVSMYTFGTKGASLGAKLGSASVVTEKLIQQLEIGLKNAAGRLGDPALDVPHIWNTTTPRTHNVTFPLFNILDTASIVRNWDLCHLLCYQNLYNKRNLFTGLPPVFYEITIPGVHYCKAGYVSKLSIQNIGNIRSYGLPIGADGSNVPVNVPDVYLINMTINDFFIPSKNFLDAIASPTKVTTLNKFAQIDGKDVSINGKDYFRTSNGALIPVGSGSTSDKPDRTDFKREKHQ